MAKQIFLEFFTEKSPRDFLPIFFNIKSLDHRQKINPDNMYNFNSFYFNYKKIALNIYIFIESHIKDYKSPFEKILAYPFNKINKL